MALARVKLNTVAGHRVVAQRLIQFALNVTERRLLYSSSKVFFFWMGLTFPNIFSGLLTKWMHEMNSGSGPSGVPGKRSTLCMQVEFTMKPLLYVLRIKRFTPLVSSSCSATVWLIHSQISTFWLEVNFALDINSPSVLIPKVTAKTECKHRRTNFTLSPALPWGCCLNSLCRHGPLYLHIFTATVPSFASRRVCERRGFLLDTHWAFSHTLQWQNGGEAVPTGNHLYQWGSRRWL